jgi:hypothetical protein
VSTSPMYSVLAGLNRLGYVCQTSVKMVHVTVEFYELGRTARCAFSPNDEQVGIKI